MTKIKGWDKIKENYYSSREKDLQFVGVIKGYNDETLRYEYMFYWDALGIGVHRDMFGNEKSAVEFMMRFLKAHPNGITHENKYKWCIK